MTNINTPLEKNLTNYFSNQKLLEANSKGNHDVY